MKAVTVVTILSLTLGCGTDLPPEVAADQEQALSLPAPWWLPCPSYSSTADFSTGGPFRATGVGCAVQQNVNTGRPAAYAFTVEFPIFVEWGCGGAVATFKRTGQPSYSVTSAFRGGRCVAVGCGLFSEGVTEGSTFLLTGNDSSARVTMLTKPLIKRFDQITVELACQRADATGDL